MGRSVSHHKHGLLQHASSRCMHAHTAPPEIKQNTCKWPARARTGSGQHTLCICITPYMSAHACVEGSRAAQGTASSAATSAARFATLQQQETRGTCTAQVPSRPPDDCGHTAGSLQELVLGMHQRVMCASRLENQHAAGALLHGCCNTPPHLWANRLSFLSGVRRDMKRFCRHKGAPGADAQQESAKDHTQAVLLTRPAADSNHCCTRDPAKQALQAAAEPAQPAGCCWRPTHDDVLWPCGCARARLVVLQCPLDLVQVHARLLGLVLCTVLVHPGGRGE